MSSCAPGTVAPDGTPNSPADPTSADYQAGYRDATVGSGEVDPGSRTGTARRDYLAGFAAGMAAGPPSQSQSDVTATEGDNAVPGDLMGRLKRMFFYAGKALGPKGIDRLKELTSPEALEMFAAFIGAQLMGVGEAADAVGLVMLAFKIGGDAVTVAEDLADCFVLTYTATEDPQLQAAGQKLADAVTLAGVDALLVFLATRGAKGENEGEGSGKGESETGEGKGEGEEEGKSETDPAEDIPEGVTDEDVHIEDTLPEEPTEPTVPDPEMTPAICFPAGTVVHTPDGVRPIEGIGVTDLVLAWRQETSAVEARAVTDVILGSTMSWIDIELDDGTHLRSTPKHHFWAEGRGAWVPAADLTAGMSVRLVDHRVAAISGTSVIPVDGEPTFNLSVDELSTYFVGDRGVLVHNMKLSRFKYLNRGGYRNYVLRAGGPKGKIYYSGMFGPNETAARVQYRHANNNDRFSPENGDYFELQPGTRTYGEARVLENTLAVENGTVKGKVDTYRCNRQQPLANEKLPEYAEYELLKGSGRCD